MDKHRKRAGALKILENDCLGAVFNEKGTGMRYHNCP
jgi:hypothetical protein